MVNWGIVVKHIQLFINIKKRLIKISYLDNNNIFKSLKNIFQSLECL